jgi:phage shock protein C
VDVIGWGSVHGQRRSCNRLHWRWCDQALTLSTPRRRRLQRIREGQKVAGVCTGLAAYAQLDVDWVRTGFVFATLLTVGFFGLVYIGMAFVLPVAETREA